MHTGVTHWHARSLTCIMHPSPHESTAHTGPAATSPHAILATSAGWYCCPTIQLACLSAKSPWQAASDSRSKPCRRQSSVSVTTTADMQRWPWIWRRRLGAVGFFFIGLNG
jgi:hypothetical protein